MVERHWLTLWLCFKLGSSSPFVLTQVIFGEGIPEELHINISVPPSFNSTLVVVVERLILGGAGSNKEQM